uniref:NAD-dependent epimerase/dehydratase family protein n=1 Tax=candidate division WOR-3 bacterium TaxID=2052148 RepID=A0A7C4TGH0_UNCW3
MNRILITGAEGFVGSYLIKVLKETLNYIIPTCFPLLKPKRGKFIPLDITNIDAVREVLKNQNPDVIFHLAAISSVGRSFRDRLITYNTNIIGTLNLLEGARILNKKIKFIFVSTCEVYGGGENLKEDSEIQLKSPYAISKYTAELICRDYTSEGFEIIILRPFNHTGPGQSEEFVLPSIAKQIAEIEQNKRPPLIEIGNIDIKREFMNVRDVILAYKLAIERCSGNDVYNISSGSGYTLAEVIEKFKKVARVKFEIKIDPARIRKTDIPVLIGNGEKFSKKTGWQPRIAIDKTVEDLLNYWRAKI